MQLSLKKIGKQFSQRTFKPSMKKREGSLSDTSITLDASFHSSHSRSSNSSNGDTGYTPTYEPEDPSKYGYGDESENTASRGYTPQHEPEDPSKYGYGDEASAETAKVNAPPQVAAQDTVKGPCNKTTRRGTSRRSSMKGSAGPPRRSSISYKGEITVSLPGQKKPVRKRQSIGFEEKVKVKTVEPIKNLSDNPEALWFQDDEYDRMKTKSFEIVDRVELGLTGGKKYCTRGLEKLMQKNQEVSQVRRYDAWDAVLNEQYSQKCEGTFNDSTMANAYSRETRNSQQDAQMRAMQDAEEIERYMVSTRRMMRRMSM